MSSTDILTNFKESHPDRIEIHDLSDTVTIVLVKLTSFTSKLSESRDFRRNVADKLVNFLRQVLTFSEPNEIKEASLHLRQTQNLTNNAQFNEIESCHNQVIQMPKSISPESSTSDKLSFGDFSESDLNYQNSKTSMSEEEHDQAFLEDEGCSETMKLNCDKSFLILGQLIRDLTTGKFNSI